MESHRLNEPRNKTISRGWEGRIIRWTGFKVKEEFFIQGIG